MPRLDVWLVENGYFSSRQTAKRAIKNGYVTVDGKLVKPSSTIRGREVIKVLDDFLDHPMGYDKLKKLEPLLGDHLVFQDSLILDIGSSAGGFLKYLVEKGATVIGIEISDAFTKELNTLVDQYPNLSIIIDDAFKIDSSIICRENELDLLFIDVTTNIDGTLKLIKRFVPLLKNNGKLIASFKSKIDSVVFTEIQMQVKAIGFANIHKVVLDEALQEFHIIAVRT